MQRLIETMDNMTIDAFVYPGWGNPPRLIGDLSQSGNTPLGKPPITPLHNSSCPLPQICDSKVVLHYCWAVHGILDLSIAWL